MESSSGLVYTVLGFSILAILLVLMRRRPARPASPGSLEGRRQDVQEKLERLVVEIQDLSREAVAKLDTRIRMMNQLLVECETKIRSLETAIGRAAPHEPAVTEPEPPPRATNPLHEQVYGLQDQGKDVDGICGATGLERGEIELILGLRNVPPPGRS